MINIPQKCSRLQHDKFLCLAVFTVLWFLLFSLAAGAASAQSGLADGQDNAGARVARLQWTQALLPGDQWTVGVPIGVELRLDQSDVRNHPVPSGYTLRLVGTRLQTDSMQPEEGLYSVPLVAADELKMVWRAEVLPPLHGFWSFRLEESGGEAYLQLRPSDVLPLPLTFKLRLTYLPEEGPSEGIYFGNTPVPSGAERPRGRDYSQYPLRPHSGGLRFLLSLEDGQGVPAVAERDLDICLQFGSFASSVRQDNDGILIGEGDFSEHFRRDVLIPRGQTSITLSEPAECPAGTSLCSVTDVLEAGGAQTLENAVFRICSDPSFEFLGFVFDDGMGFVFDDGVRSGAGIVNLRQPIYNGLFVRADLSSVRVMELTARVDGSLASAPISVDQTLELTITAQGLLNSIPAFPESEVQDIYLEVMESYNGGEPERILRYSSRGLLDPLTSDPALRTISRNFSAVGEYRYTLREPVEQNDAFVNEHEFSVTVRVRSVERPQLQLSHATGFEQEDNPLTLILSTALPSGTALGTHSPDAPIRVEVAAHPADEETYRAQAEAAGNFRNALTQRSLHFDNKSQVCEGDGGDNCEVGLYDIQRVGAGPDGNTAIVFSARSYGLWDVDTETGILTRNEGEEAFARHRSYTDFSITPDGRNFLLASVDSFADVYRISDDGLLFFLAQDGSLFEEPGGFRGNPTYGPADTLAYYGRVEETGETNTLVRTYFRSGFLDLNYQESTPSQTSAFLPSYTGPLLYAFHPDSPLLFAAQQDGDFLSLYAINRDPVSSYCGTDFLREYPQPLPYDICEAVAGLDDISALAVSPGGRWLYTLSKGERALGVWRINLAGSTLKQRALYAEGENTCAENAAGCFDGFDSVGLNAIEVFENRVITAGDNTLHLWEAAPDGSLRLLAYYRGGGAVCPPDAENCTDGFQGLSGIRDLTFSAAGDLLFVAASDLDLIRDSAFLSNHALSVWKLGEQSSAFVRATATLGTDYRFGLDEESLNFEPGALAPGTWRFYAREVLTQEQATPQLDTFGAMNTVEITPVLRMSLMAEQSIVATGSVYAVEVGLDQEPSRDIRININVAVRNQNNQIIETRSLVFFEELFTAALVFDPVPTGVIRITASASPRTLVTPSEAEVTVEVTDLPIVSVAAENLLVTEGELASVPLRLSKALAETARVELTASRGAMRIVRGLTLPTTDSLSLSVPFCTAGPLPDPRCPGQEVPLGEGDWIFQLTGAEPPNGTVALSPATALVRVQSLPVLSLAPPASEPLVGQEFFINVQADRPLTQDVTGFSVRAERGDLRLESSMVTLLAEGAQSQFFPMPLFSIPGIWEFSLLAGPDFSENAVLSASTLAVRVAIPRRVRAASFTVVYDSSFFQLAAPLDVTVRLNEEDLQAQPTPGQPFPAGYAIEVLAEPQGLGAGEPVQIMLRPEPGFITWNGTTAALYPADWTLTVMEPGDADYLAGEELFRERVQLPAVLRGEVLQDQNIPIRIPHRVRFGLYLEDEEGEPISLPVPVAGMIGSEITRSSSSLPVQQSIFAFYHPDVQGLTPTIPAGSTSIEFFARIVPEETFLVRHDLDPFDPLTRPEFGGFGELFADRDTPVSIDMYLRVISFFNFLEHSLVDAPSESRRLSQRLSILRDGLTITSFIVRPQGRAPGSASARTNIVMSMDAEGYMYDGDEVTLNVRESCNGESSRQVGRFTVSAASAATPEQLVISGLIRHELPFLAGVCVYTLSEPQAQENFFDNEQDFALRQDITGTTLSPDLGAADGITVNETLSDIYDEGLNYDISSSIRDITVTMRLRVREGMPGEDPTLFSSYDGGGILAPGELIRLTMRIVSPSGQVNPLGAFFLGAVFPDNRYPFRRGEFSSRIPLTITDPGIWTVSITEITIGGRTIPASESTGIGPGNTNPVLAFAEDSYVTLRMNKEGIAEPVSVLGIVLEKPLLAVGEVLTAEVTLTPPRFSRTDITVQILGPGEFSASQDLSLLSQRSSITVTQSLGGVGEYTLQAEGRVENVILPEMSEIETVTVVLPSLNFTGTETVISGESVLVDAIASPVGPSAQVSVAVTARRQIIADGIPLVRERVVTLGPDSAFGTLNFGALAPGRWSLSATVAPEDSALLNTSSASFLVTVSPPSLVLTSSDGSQETLAFQGQRITLLVSASFAPVIPVQVELRDQLDGSLLGGVQLNPGAFQSVPVSIIVGGEPGGTWVIAGMDPSGLLDDRDASVAFNLLSQAGIALEVQSASSSGRVNPIEVSLLGSAVELTLRTTSTASLPLPPDFSSYTEVRITATAPDNSTRVLLVCWGQAAESFAGALGCPEETTGSGTVIAVPFAPGQAGVWSFDAAGVQHRAGDFGASSEPVRASTMLTVVLPRLLFADVSQRENLEISVPVSAEGSPLTTVTVTVQALRLDTRAISVADVQLSRGGYTEVPAVFAGQNRLTEGMYELSAAAAMPSGVVDVFNSATAVLIVEPPLPVLRLLPAEQAVAAGSTAVVTLSLDKHPEQDVRISVTALHVGTDSRSTASAVFAMSTSSLTAQRVFFATESLPTGRYRLSARAETEEVVNTSLAEAVFTVLPRLRLSLPGRAFTDREITVLLSLNAAPASTVSVGVAAAVGTSATTAEAAALGPDSYQDVPAVFAADALAAGIYDLSAAATPTGVIYTAAATAALTVEPPLPVLRLLPAEQVVAAGSTAVVTLSLDTRPEQDVRITVTALHVGTGSRSAASAVFAMSLSAVTMQTVFFATESLPTGRYQLSARAETEEVVNTSLAEAAFTVLPSLSLSLPERSFANREISVSISLNAAPASTVSVEVAATASTSVTTAEAAVLGPDRYRDVPAVFAADALAAGIYDLSATATPTGVIYTAAATAVLTVEPPLPVLRLLPAEQVAAAGSTVTVTLSLDRALQQAATITITASSASTGTVLSVSVRLPQTSTSAIVVFSAGSLGLDRWLLEAAASPADTVIIGSSAALQILPPDAEAAFFVSADVIVQGADLMLTAVLNGTDELITDTVLTVGVTGPDGVRSPLLLQLEAGAGRSESISYVPDVSGLWRFEVEQTDPALLMTASSSSVTVLPAVALSLAGTAADGRELLGRDVTLRLEAAVSASLLAMAGEVRILVTARARSSTGAELAVLQGDGVLAAQPLASTITFTADEFIFDAGNILLPVPLRWDFRGEFRGDGRGISTTALTMERPRLRLSPAEQELPWGSALRLQAESLLGEEQVLPAGSSALVEVAARRQGGALLGIDGMPAADGGMAAAGQVYGEGLGTSLSISLDYGVLSPGDWIFTAETRSSSLQRVFDLSGGARATVLPVPLSLALVSGRTADAGSTVTVLVSAARAPAVALRVDVAAEHIESARVVPRLTSVLLSPTGSSQAGSFLADLDLGVYRLMVTAVPSGVATTAAATAELVVREPLPVLRLLPAEQAVIAGSTVAVTLSLDKHPEQDVRITVTALHVGTGSRSTAAAVFAMSSSSLTMQTVFFATESLPTGGYRLSARAETEEVVNTSLAEAVFTVLPRLRLSLPERSFANREISVSVSLNAAPASTVSVGVAAIAGTSVTTAEAVVLGPDRYRDVSAVFAADALAAGIYDLSATATPTGVIYTAAATAVLTVEPPLPVLRLLPAEQVVAAGSTAAVMLSLDRALQQAATITITASSASTGASLAVSVRLPQTATSAIAVFSAGSLGPDRWLLEAAASPADTVIIGSSAALQVLPPDAEAAFSVSANVIVQGADLTLTADLNGTDGLITGTVLTVGVTGPDGVRPSLLLQLEAGARSESISYAPDVSGLWRFEVEQTDPAVLMTASSSSVTVLPAVALSLAGTAADGRELLGRGVTLRLETAVSASLLAMAGEVRILVTARARSSTGAELAVLQGDGVLAAQPLASTITFTADEFIFDAGNILLPVPLRWDFRGEFQGDGRGISTTALTMERPRLRLSPAEQELPWGSALRLQAESLLGEEQVLPAGSSARVEVTARRQGGALLGIDGMPAADGGMAAAGQVYGEGLGTSLSISLDYGVLSPGDWIFTAETSSSSLQRVFDLSGRARATVLPVPLSLALVSGRTADAGSTVTVLVSAARAPAVALQVDVAAEHIESARVVPRLTRVLLSPAGSSQAGSFLADLDLGVYRLMVTAVPSGVATTAAATAELVVREPLPVLRLLPAEQAVIAGRTATVTLSLDKQPEQDVRITVTALHVGTGGRSTASAVFTMSSSAATMQTVFFATESLLTGRYRLSARAETEEVVNTSLAEAVFTVLPRLSLSLPARAFTDREITVLLSLNAAPASTVSVGVAATAGMSVTTAEAAALGPDRYRDVPAVFAADALAAGIYDLSATATPTGVIYTAAATAVLTVEPPLPVLRLLPAEQVVAAGSTAAVTLSLDKRPEQDVRITVTALHVGTGSRSAASAVFAMSSSAVTMQTVFFATESLPTGRYQLSARAETEEVVNTSLAEAVFTVLPRLSLSLPARAFTDREITVLLSLNAAPASTVSVGVAATAGMSVTTAEAAALGPDRYRDVPAVFAADALAAGIYDLSATATPTGVIYTAAATAVLVVEPPLPVLHLLPAEQTVIAGSTVAVTLSLDKRPEQDVRITVTALHVGTDSRSEASAVFAMSSSAVTMQTVFFATESLPTGRYQLSARAETEEVVNTSLAEAVFTVLLPRLRLSLPARAFTDREITVLLSLNAAPASTVSVEVAATAGTSVTTAEAAALGPDRYRDVPAVFAADALAAGIYDLSATATPTGVIYTAAATAVLVVEPPLLPVLRLLPGEQAVIAGSTVAVTLSLDKRPEQDVRITVTALHVSTDSRSTASAVFAISSSSLTAQMVFFATESLPTGRYQLSARAETEEIVNTSMAEAAFTILSRLSLSPRSQLLMAGSTVMVTVSLEPAEREVAVTVMAFEIALGVTETISTILSESTPSEIVSFAAGRLSPGEWLLSLSADDDGVNTDATATISIRPAVLSLEPKRLYVLTTQEPTLTLRRDRGYSGALQVTATAVGISGNSVGMISQAIILLAGTETAAEEELRFTRLSEGTWDVSLAASPADIADVSGATATVIVSYARVPIRLAAAPSPGIPGAPVTVTAVLDAPIEGYRALLSLAITPPDDSGSVAGTLTRTITLEPGGGSSEQTFVPDVEGRWRIEVVDATDLVMPDIFVADALGSSTALEVLAVRLDFSSPTNGVNVDDLVLALRYLDQCGRTICFSAIHLADLGLMDNLRGEYDLESLFAGLLVVPDLTGDGIGNAADLVLLQGRLSGVPANILLSSDVQPMQIYVNIIRQALAPPAEE